MATPIGNLEDITLRALRVLREVTLIAAEDTRRTAKLLGHYRIHTTTTSFHGHNETRKGPALLARLARGNAVAIMSPTLAHRCSPTLVLGSCGTPWLVGYRCKQFPVLVPPWQDL